MIEGPFLVMAGPTAVGKSEIALLLAQELNGEIVSVDSMQIYRGMDIGTAKPSITERARVPHHLVDIVEIRESFDAARFVQLSGVAISEIHDRGRLPILCGGTGLYFKALLEGLGSAPRGDSCLRAELERKSPAELLKELAAADPKIYERIDRQNPRRVVRALEVIRLSGKPLSEQRAAWSASPPTTLNSGRLWALTRAAEELRSRIDGRVDEMFRRGLVAETKQLLERGLGSNPTASQALGYKQVIEHLEGARSLHDTIELIKTRTRQYAKRQMTWFRRQHPFSWIPIQRGETARSIVERIVAGFKVPPLIERG